MPDYQAMYLLLFNAITDALHDMEHNNFGLAAQRLKQAQTEAEEIYLADE